jgi:tetratricopeptide (TPR) repeat protein
MYKKVLLFAGLIISAVSVSGQKTLKVTEKDMSMVVFRCAGDNETVVELQSNVPLTFESTMDKEIAFCDTIAENGFFFYQLKFTVDKKFKGRKLKIKSYGFETHAEPLDLQPKVPVGLLVLDPNSDVGVGCYFEHLNKGNRFFDNTQYADAKAEYLLALECSDMPDDNNLSKKIEDAGTAVDSKHAADDYYNADNPVDALREYEKLLALNPNDAYTRERIEACKNKFNNLDIVIRGKAVGDKGEIMSNAKIETEAYKFDKKGNLVYDKDGLPQREKFLGVATLKAVGATDSNGNFEITVKRINKKLRFTRPNPEDKKHQYLTEIMITNGEMNVVMEPEVTLEDLAKKGKGVIDIFK